ncbi:SUMF1/EgtB/PvdO family nonheme iron enzyme [Bremerella sp.]|uniref:SUMF1/EgtB/PvdO family nonheme iron enzyme n=1 Tax=Bremerella sp. TaxID=2795602 RepID=UPI00391DBBD8
MLRPSSWLHPSLGPGFIFFSAIVLAMTMAMPLLAQQRRALIVCNWDYSKLSNKSSAPYQLKKVKDDLATLAQALESRDFDVIWKENVGRELKQIVQEYAESTPTGSVSLIYLMGFGGKHQFQGGKDSGRIVSGIYPVDRADPISSVELLREVRRRSRARLQLICLDCCYTLPDSDPSSNGLEPIPEGELPSGAVCFGAHPDRHLSGSESSHLAKQVAKVLEGAGQPLEEMFPRQDSKWVQYSDPAAAQAVFLTAGGKKTEQSKLPPSNPKPGDQWINGHEMVFCWCPPGSYTMGIEQASESRTRDASPVEVTIQHGFWMSKYEVTIGDHRRVRGRDPSGGYLLDDANLPIAFTNGPRATDFGPKLLEKAEQDLGALPNGWTYRLPTEAEWEYACRAGSQSKYSFGDSVSEFARYGNIADQTLRTENGSYAYADSSLNDGYGLRPAPVGSYLPNAWGLHDMHGNVAEYVLDVYEDTLPGGTSPNVQTKSNEMVYRGGAWCSLPDYCASGFRNSTTKSNNHGAFDFLGFRVILAREVDGRSKE